MKKIILLISSLIVLIACDRQRDPIDTGSAIVFGKEDITPNIDAPCIISNNHGILGIDTFYISTQSASYIYPDFVNYMIAGQGLFNDFSIILSEKPTIIPDTINFDNPTKNSIYIKSMKTSDGSYTYTPDYSKISNPIYLYINKVGSYTTYQVCNLPVYNTSSYYGTKNKTFSVHVSVK